MRIAIVNDTLMSMFTLKRIVESDKQHSIAWTAEDGEQAVAACKNDTPDIILMDIIMPVMDGVEATKQIMENSPCAILLVTSSVDSNASKVFEAMGAGALDAINTPVIESSDGKATDNNLLAKIAMVSKLILHEDKSNKAFQDDTLIKRSHLKSLIAVGSSTGGPNALVRLLKDIPKDFPAAFIIVQHVDKQFIDGFVSWLNDQVTLPVRMANKNDKIIAGTILVANSKEHLVLSKNQTLQYTKEPKDYPYVPSVNTFFESVAQHWQGKAVGVLLTGMGRDGANGLLEMKNKKFTTFAQKESTCAVYGMPKAAVDIDAADFILSPIDISTKIVQSLTEKDLSSK